MNCQAICEQYGNAAIVTSVVGGIALNAVASYALKHFPENPIVKVLCQWLQAPHPSTNIEKTNGQ